MSRWRVRCKSCADWPLVWRDAGVWESNHLHVAMPAGKDLASAYVTLEARQAGTWRTILESIPTAVLSLDPEEAVTHVNDRADSVSGRRRRNARGGPKSWRSPIISPPILWRVAAAAAQGRPHRLDLRANGDGGRGTTLVLSVTAASMNAHRAAADCAAPAPGIRHGIRRSFGAFASAEAGRPGGKWRGGSRMRSKNPLTPIALSESVFGAISCAGLPIDKSSRRVIAGCTETSPARWRPSGNWSTSSRRWRVFPRRNCSLGPECDGVEALTQFEGPRRSPTSAPSGRNCRR